MTRNTFFTQKREFEMLYKKQQQTVKILQKSTYFVTTEEGDLIPSHCSCVHSPIHKPLIKAEHSTLSTRLKGMENSYPEIFSNLGVPHIISFFSFFLLPRLHFCLDMIIIAEAPLLGLFGGGGGGGFGGVVVGCFLKK